MGIRGDGPLIEMEQEIRHYAASSAGAAFYILSIFHSPHPLILRRIVGGGIHNVKCVLREVLYDTMCILI